MVLEARLKYFFLLVPVLISTGCNASSQDITDKAEIKNYQLTLKNKESSCQLESSYKKTEKNYTLEIKSPCYFMRKDNKEVQTFEYRDVDVQAAILILGNPVSDEKRKKWNLSEKEICGESRQAILIKSSGLVISEKILEGGLACKDLGSDEKDFSYFARQFK